MTEPTTLSAVAVLSLPEDRICLEEIFRRSKWRLGIAGCLREARALFSRPDVGLVLTDSHLPDGGWKEVLHEVERRPVEAPPVIVASRRADERLWAEVLNLRGYDVLEMPFHASEVLWSVGSAWRHWRTTAFRPRAVSGQIRKPGVSRGSAG